ncbi:MAG: helix-turn-helix domain-containing protein [Verrucomicrobia bacterium]|nr:helix-turn-helix domain-containing protein [Verrucomicrobiota bacterium]MBS0646092.1 helix-turn-helix domain-containing protein [Verrucomicrobiota bacterium]
MSIEQQQLGDYLRKKREERHLSLKEIESGTSIRMSYLRLIEEGKLNQLISPVYAQGFIRKYAGFLGLDDKKLFEDHPQVLYSLTTPSAQSPDLSGLGSVEVRGSPSRDRKWMHTATWVGGSATTVLILWFIARNLGIV